MLFVDRSVDEDESCPPSNKVALTNKEAAASIKAKLVKACADTSINEYQNEASNLSSVGHIACPIPVGIVVKERPSIDAVKTNLTLQELKEAANATIATKVVRKRKFSLVK